MKYEEYNYAQSARELFAALNDPQLHLEVLNKPKMTKALDAAITLLGTHLEMIDERESLDRCCWEAAEASDDE